MSTTFQQRQSEAALLMRSGKGLTAIPLKDRDIVIVKDPSYKQPGSSAVVVWREWAGGAAKTAYGL